MRGGGGGAVREVINIFLEACHAFHVAEYALLVVGSEFPSVEVFLEGIGCHLQDYGDWFYLMSSDLLLLWIGFVETPDYRGSDIWV